MTTLIITRGLPGSGKTTSAMEWVDEDAMSRVRVNRDELRHNLFGAYWGLDYSQEQTVTVAQQAAVKALLDAGKSVIVDDTNLRLRNARAWADLAIVAGADFDVWDITTPVDECVARDARRARVVGEDVIRKMALRYVAPWPEVKPSERTAQTAPAKYVGDGSLPPAWLVDIDGTLAHMGDRSPYDTTTVGNDEPDWTIITLARALADQGSELVIMSGRSEECRAATEAWLEDHLGFYTDLHMRAADDKRQDYKVKADLFDTHVRNRWNVKGVLDDRDQVVKMWRGMGIKCLQVADGAF